MAHMHEALEAITDPSIRHIVPVSGGKDSAALAIYLVSDLPADSQRVRLLRHRRRITRDLRLPRPLGGSARQTDPSHQRAGLHERHA